MGKGMALNLAKHGFDVIAYNRTKRKADEIAGGKIKAAGTLLDVCSANVIFTCLPSDVALLEAFTTLQHPLKGKILIDCSTTSIDVTQQIAQKAHENGFSFIDAPITGSKLGAEKGTLMFMLGGEKKVIDGCIPIFQAMGKHFVHCGKNTFGQRMKIALNVTMAMMLESYLEGVVLAMKNGLPLHTIQEVFDNSAAANGIASWKMPLIKERDFSDPHFMAKLMHKDILLAEQERKKLGLHLPLAEQMLPVFQEVMNRGEGNDDWSTIVKTLEKMAGIEIKE